MIDSNIIINTCYQTQNSLQTIVRFSHIIPIVLSLTLAFFVFFKAKYNLLSKIFLSFVVMFCTWLIGDHIAWSSLNYFFVYSTWSILDYIEILFYVLGLYFAIVFVKQTGISVITRIGLFLLTIPPLIIVLSGEAVTGFNYPVCEALNSDFLGNYKLVVEILILLIILGYTIVPFIKKYTREKKRADLIVLGSMFLFLSIFGITEYIASNTGYYELNLYSLFLLPVFLIAIIYAVFELDIFKFHILGTYYLVAGLVIMSGGQLFFINGRTEGFVTLLTVVLTIGLSYILFKNLKKESDQRVFIEKLSIQLEESNTKLENANEKLKGLDKLKTEFLSLASHQLRSPLTAIKGYTSMLLEGDFGIVNDKQKEAIDRVFQSSKHLTVVVEDLLNVSKIEQGGMQYVMVPFDFEKAVKDLATDLGVTAEKKALKLTFETDSKAPYTVNGDMEKLRQVILNLIDNSVKYTKEGWIKVMVTKDEANKKIKLAVSDSGMGISPNTINELFQKFSRGEGGKMNSGGSGLGLYLGKEIVTAHKGRIWAESEGEGKGSTFAVELDMG